MKNPRYLSRTGMSLCALLLVLAGCATAPPQDTLHQYSTIDALLIGLYDGDLSIHDLGKMGDFGIGTFNALDGEMAVLDGIVYQARHDGSVKVVHETLKTPFATVSFFHPEQTLDIEAGLDYASLKQRLDKSIRSLNRFYAVRIEGSFPYVKVRSVPRQTPPYAPLKEVIEQQAVFELTNTREPSWATAPLPSSRPSTSPDITSISSRTTARPEAMYWSSPPATTWPCWMPCTSSR